MACQVPPADQLTNVQKFLSPEQLAAYSSAELALELGTALVADVAVIPAAPFIWGALAIADVLGLFGGGRPKDQDTNNVIGAYNQSAYEPLHALATNLSIALRNGAPISDSNPDVQRQFSTWKQGTIESIQQQAGLAPGPSSPGYWQLQELINTSWAYSGNGQQAVLQVVRAIDCFLEALTQIAQQTTQPPPGGPPPGPPAPPLPSQGPCVSGDPDSDEILDLCNAVNTNLTAILAAIKALGDQGAGGAIDPCCAAVVAAIGNVVSQLANITALLSAVGGTPEPLDLSGIVTALGELVAAVAAYPPALQACCALISGNLNAIATSLGPDAGQSLSSIAKAIGANNEVWDVPQTIIDQMAADGSLSPQMAQLISGAWYSWVVPGFLSTAWKFIAGGVNPDLGADVAANIQAVANGQAPPTQPIKSLVDIPFYLLALIGTYWSKWAVNLGAAILPSAELVAQQIGKTVTDQIGDGGTGLALGVGAPAAAALRYVQSAPAPGEVITTGNYQGIVQDAMGRAGLMGGTAYIAAMVGGFLLGPWEKYWGEVAAMIATAAGFEEISARWMDPFLDAVIRNRAIQDANQKWPTRVPPGAQALALWARRKINDADVQELMGTAGWDPSWRDQILTGAYRPVQPRTLVQLFLDQPIDQNVLTTMLRDTALSENNVALMAQAITYKSIANVRNSYLSALISGYGKGVVGDDELQEALTEFNFSPQAQQYVKAHVLILRREVVAQKAQSEIVPLVANGGMAPDVGLQQLEIAGLQPWLAQLEITLATTKADIAILKKELALEAKTLLQEQRNATRAAIAEFQRGVLNEAGLTAALTAIGLDPVLIASVVAVQDATRTGRMKFIYGQLLSPANARILTERVGAIATQVKEELITTDQALAQLKQLGVDAADANAIVARAIAAIAAKSTRGTLLSPITGQPP